ncbi:hypothetical protein [Rhodococcoides fascians]|uniref:hypothetical protein n=1 Tax=Rhodococcoides fascians TaxID=1828 RepID=UPI000AEF1D69|nr:hypothetical protein [Rhodococcus fascians]
MGTIISTIDRNYPTGAVVSVFYPDAHKFRFMTWTANDESAGGIDAHERTTIGMAIAAIDSERGQWASKVSQAFSTRELESNLTSV